MKYILVTGGVVSGLGKGVTASSIGVLLKACGVRVTSIKIGTCGLGCFVCGTGLIGGRGERQRAGGPARAFCGVTRPLFFEWACGGLKSGFDKDTLLPVPADPYLNVDAGTMSPLEHGEVFVLDDGGEVG